MDFSITPKRELLLVLYYKTEDHCGSSELYSDIDAG